MLHAVMFFGVVGCADPFASDPAEAVRDAPSSQASREVSHATVSLALSEPDALARAEALASAFRRLPAGELPGVLSAYEEGFFDLGASELVLFAEWWAAFDPKAALAWAAMDWTTNTTQVRYTVMRAWARRDPEAALRVAESSAAARARASDVDAVLSGWEDSGKPGAFEFVRAMARGADRQRAIATLARRKVLREGIDAAFDWAASLPADEDKFKLNVIRRVGSASAQVDPKRASERASEFVGTEYADGLLRHVGTRWARRVDGGPHAMGWVISLPRSKARDDAVAETYRAWLQSHDREEAARYFDDPATRVPGADHAVAIYAELVAGTKPREALQLPPNFEDDDFRWATLGRIWRAWWVHDSHAAEAWWEKAKSEVPEFYRERIVQIPPALRLKRSRLRQAQGDVPLG